jgi:hypothetical protein
MGAALSSAASAASAASATLSAPPSALADAVLGGVAGHRSDRWVLDGYGVALARLRQAEHRQARRVGTTIHSFTYDVSVGTRHPRRLTAIHVTLSMADASASGRFRARRPQFHHHREPTLTIEYEDPSTGEQSRIGCAGDWEQRRAAVLFLDHGTMVPRQAVAKIFRPNLDGLLGLTASSAFRVGNAYNVEVAPGVDAALVLLICAAIDDAILQARDAAGRGGDASDAVATLGDDQDERRSSKARSKGPEGDSGAAVGLLRRIHHRLLPPRS